MCFPVSPAVSCYHPCSGSENICGGSKDIGRGLIEYLLWIWGYLLWIWEYLLWLGGYLLWLMSYWLSPLTGDTKTTSSIPVCGFVFGCHCENSFPDTHNNIKGSR